MAEAHMLSIDLAKRSFQVCATDRAGSVLYDRTVTRPKLEALLKEQPRRIIAMEACATSHFWGRTAEAEGRTHQCFVGQRTQASMRCEDIWPNSVWSSHKARLT